MNSLTSNILTDLLFQHCFTLDQDAILKLNSLSNSGELNNVITGLDKHSFSIMLIEDKNEIKYHIFYVNATEMLKGDLLQLTVNMAYRDELVFYFANYLSENNKNSDLIDTFNTFQRLTRSMLEKLGFLTIASTELEQYAGKSATFIAKGVRGIIPIHNIKKMDFYKDFFGLKGKIGAVNNEMNIYLMFNIRNGYFKIGKSKNPSFREKTLQADEPHIELIASWNAPSSFERKLHQEYKKQRKRGEWFKLTFNELKQIKELMKEYK